jgi:hypothetical protein
VRFLDFEGGCWRNVLLDAGYLRVPFPSCWCSFGLPAGMTEAMVAAWRAEIRDVWPDLDDDAVLLPALLDAQLLWVWVSTWWFLPRPGDDDKPVGTDSRAPRRSVALRSRWLRLAYEATRVGEHDLAAHAHSVVAGLAARFGDQGQLPAYPAFRKIKP